MNLLLCIGSPMPSEVEIHETREHLFAVTLCIGRHIFELSVSSFFKFNSDSGFLLKFKVIAGIYILYK